MQSDLRPYQAEALENLRASVRQGVRRIVLQAPTGAGKTKIAAAVVNSAIAKDKKVAFVVPSISLIDQSIEAFYAEGIKDVGVIQADHMMTNWRRPIQICSIQTIHSKGEYPKADILIFDECHRIFKAHIKWMLDPEWQKVPIIGLSATPWTRGLGKYFESLLVVATTQELIDQKHLSPFRVFASGKPDLSEVKVVAGDYHEGQLSTAMQKGELTADIIKTWKELWGKGKTLCFGVDKAHAKSIQERFEFAGVPCGYQDAETSPIERAQIKRDFHSGRYQVVSNIQTLTTGVDWDVRCLILARPTHSEMLYTQIIGRALRTAEGKEHALILDHSNTTQRLGFVTDIHHEHLSEAKEQKDIKIIPKPRLPKECKQCTALVPAGIMICPNCGTEIKIVSSLIEGDGILTELEKGKIHKRARKEYSTGEKAIFLSELKALAIQKGYKRGWADQKFKSKFGMWPHHSYADVAPARIVSPDVALWVRAENLKWVKSKAAAERNSFHVR